MTPDRWQLPYSSNAAAYAVKNLMSAKSNDLFKDSMHSFTFSIVLLFSRNEMGLGVLGNFFMIITVCVCLCFAIYFDSDLIHCFMVSQLASFDKYVVIVCTFVHDKSDCHANSS